MHQLSNSDLKGVAAWVESPPMESQIVKLDPGRVAYVGMLRLENTSNVDTFYIRKSAHAIKVSKRPPANYGSPKK
jgi:hypothetical protein